MHNLIHYKEHYGRISFSAAENNYSSNVKGSKVVSNDVSVKGKSEAEVKKAFKDFIDEITTKDTKKKI